MSDLTHFDSKGDAHMVDISAKSMTDRIAVAKGIIKMAPQTAKLIQTGASKKGDVLGIARIAGIMAAKKTSELIPLCHPIPISKISLEFELSSTQVAIEATVKTSGQTGVEMEALTAVNVAALTIYDMLKAADKTMTIDNIHLALKDGGKSGRYTAE